MIRLTITRQALRYYTYAIMRLLSCLFLLIFTFPVKGHGQTCCTGGAPLVGTINLYDPEDKTLNFSVSYDINKIEDFFQESEKLNEDFIRRKTKTLFAQFTYAFDSKISATVLVPYVWLSENIDGFNNTEKNTNSNIGDVTLLGQYKLLKKEDVFLSLGLGIKLPTGETRGKDPESQFILPPTMQSGTGSVDYILLVRGFTRIPFRKSLTFNQAFYYKLNGNSSSFTSHSNYSFGNEFQSISSFSDQLLIANLVNYPSLLLRIRATTKDDVDSYRNPNTGGLWAYIGPGWSIQMFPAVQVSVRYELPVFRRLQGFQITTSHRLNASFIITI